MPIKKVGKKYKIGSGKAMYHSKKKALKAYVAYLAKEGSEKTEKHKDKK